ncbi:histidine kinase dimerization/phospho-acceptor domain-containing protein [Hoeflea sp. AS60]|uniref:histidine kinase dimerization/phospho-acceptor domain-containing protein n=1 Tax=Hoeflea sp. AS60 TaxID=3135780 RepID=UPI00316F1D4C
MTATPALDTLPIEPAVHRSKAARSRLINALCHDCRTPLAVIAELANLLREDFNSEDPTETIDFLRLISKRVVEIEGYIADYHELNRISMQPSDANPRQLAIADVLDQLEPVLQAIVSQRDNALTLHCDPETPITRCSHSALKRAITAIVTELSNTATCPVQIFVIGAPANEGRGIHLAMVRSDLPVRTEKILATVTDPASQVALENSDAAFKVLVADALIGHAGGHINCTRHMKGGAFTMFLPAVSDTAADQQDQGRKDQFLEEVSPVRGDNL